MGLRDRMYELTEVEEVEEFLDQHPNGAIFKAGTCHKTTQTFDHVERAFDPREALYMAFVQVVQSRPVSTYIAEKTQIVHQSPQLILFVDRQPVFDVDNWNITLDVVEQALQRHFGSVSCQKGECGCACRKPSDVLAYTQLLNAFLDGQLNSADFKRRWLMTLQMDSTPRTAEQYEVLNGLFGDMRAPLHQLASHGEDYLKKRVFHVLELLNL